MTSQWTLNIDFETIFCNYGDLGLMDNIMTFWWPLQGNDLCALNVPWWQGQGQIHRLWRGPWKYIKQ